ncbi:MAG: EAL domain-containing protein [Lautropia sp.]
MRPHADADAHASDPIDALAVAASVEAREALAADLERSLEASEQSGQHLAVLMIDFGGPALAPRTRLGLNDRVASLSRQGDALHWLQDNVFALVLNGLGFREEWAAVTASRIAMRLRRGDGEGARIGANPWVGISMCLGRRLMPEVSIRLAHAALRRARDEGLDATRFACPVLDAKVRALAEIDHELQHAIDAREFVLQLQPIVDRRGALARAEALVRWRHPRLGHLLGPDRFLDRAAENGLLVPIGYQVFELACQQLAFWSRDAGLSRIAVSVNLGQTQLADRQIADRLATMTAEYRVPPQRLVLEVAESTIAWATDDTHDRLDALRARGFGIAIDGFGSGALSLAALRELPVSELKLLPALLENPSDPLASIVGSVHRRGMQVVAGRLESRLQMRRALDLDCDGFQGFLVGRPASGSAALLRSAANTPD